MMWTALTFVALVGAADAATAPAESGYAPEVTPAAYAAAPTEAEPAMSPEEAELLGIIEEETAVAKSTRLNSDYVPGIVAVLHGSELEALGATNVWEALSLVAGVQPVRDQLGRPSVIVRGTYFPFNMGNIKVLVDDVPLSREASGINSFVLDMPIEQVERIEVIRGPGSILYGDFAFMGLVKIVTRREGYGVFSRGGTDRRGLAGARGVIEQAGLTASVNVAGLRGFDTPLMSGKTAETEWESGVFSLGFEGLRFSGMLVNANSIDLGRATQTSPVLNHGEIDWAVEGAYDHAFRPDLRSTTRLSYLRNRIDTLGNKFDGGLAHGTLELTWEGWRNQAWLAGFEYIEAKIDRAEQIIAAPAGPGQGAAPRTAENKARQAFAGTLENNVTLGERFSIIPGARFDHYSDIGERVTPRMAAVWRLAEFHILKAQYAEGFRTPTYFELYAEGARNTGLTFEVNRTAELNYIYRVPNMVTRLTLFGSRIENMIYIDAAAFTADREGRAYGVEGEWERQLHPLVKALVHASWVRSDDSRNAAGVLEPGPTVPQWMGDLGAVVGPVAHTSLGVHWNHVAARTAARANDPIDLTLSREQLGLAGLTLRAGVKNILDQDILYVTHSPAGTAVIEYPGRSVWAGVSYGR